MNVFASLKEIHKITYGIFFLLYQQGTHSMTLIWVLALYLAKFDKLHHWHLAK